MTYTSDIDDKTRVELREWNEAVDFKIHCKRIDLGTWQCMNGVLLDNRAARSLAIALLNMSGNKDVLKKKYMW